MGLLSKLSIGAIDLPVGPQADVRELEYISCLLQTSLPDVRDDATISATDVRLYLRSRYGLSVTPEVAADIVSGLGGGDEERRRRYLRSLRQEQRQQKLLGGNLAEGCDLVGGDADEADDAADDGKDEAVSEDDDKDLKEVSKDEKAGDDEAKKDSVCADNAQTEVDEEMGLFASATSASSVVDGGNVGGDELGAATDAGTGSANRQSSIFFDAIQSETDIEVDDDKDDDDSDDRIETEKQEDTGTGRYVITDVEDEDEGAIATDQSVKEAAGESKRKSVQWSKKLSASSKPPAPPISPSTTEASENREAYLDLPQVLGTLLIPTLIKAKREADIANGVIEDDPPIPDDPERSFHLLLRHPRQFFANQKESKRLRRRRKERAERDSLRPTPRRLIRDVLIMLLHHVDEINPNPMLRRAQESKDVRKKSPVSGSTPRLRRVVINEDLVRNILLAFGEIDAAEDEELIREMVIVAGGDGAVLDELAFAQALTSDILAWTCGLEDGINETFADVFGFDPVAKNEYNLAKTVLEAGANVVTDAADLALATGIAAANVATETVDAVKPVPVGMGTQGSESRSDDCNDPTGVATQALAAHKEKEKSQEDPIKFVHTAPYIDYVCDSFRSLLFQMALYVFYLFSATIAMSMIGTLNMSSFIKCEPSFWCNLGSQVWQWFVLALILCASGVAIIAPISMANDPYNRSWKRTMLSITWLLTITLTNFFAFFFYEKGIPHDPSGKLNELERLVQGFYFQLGVRVYLAFGLILCCFMFRFVFQMCVSRELIRRNRILRALTLPYGILRSTDTKKACTRKLNDVLTNAIKMHFSSWNGVKVTAAEKFVIEPEESVRVGGLVWSWWNLLNQKLCNHYGIWLQSRLAIAQECQAIVLLFGIVLLVWGSETLAADTERKRAEIQNEPDGPLKDEALRFVPEGWVVEATFAFGGVFAVGVAVVIILVYLPSTVATILALRAGKIATFRDREHLLVNRKASDKVFYNVANCIYALLGSASLFFIIFGGLLFLFLWPVTSETMFLILSWCLGLSITIGMKTILMTFSRKEFHQALMRRRVKHANYNALAMECWQLGVGGGALLSRLGQFLFAAAFWIGRIDVVFLDEDVSLFGYSFDYLPINYRTELLVHETHKHPWINRIGGMFLMRIKYGEEFSSAAGAKWRLLFTLSLFPWLVRHRKKRGDDDDSDEEDFMALSSISSPSEGRVERLKRRIAAREGLGGLQLFKKKENDVEKEEANESSKDGAPHRTGYDVFMG